MAINHSIWFLGLFYYYNVCVEENNMVPKLYFAYTSLLLAAFKYHSNAFFIFCYSNYILIKTT
jgi:hypothetical protein